MPLLRRIRALGKRSELQREIEEEVQAHLAMRTEDNLATGMKPETAAREARLRFGNPTAVKERVTGMDAALELERAWWDFRYALRQLRKSPGFALTVVMTLALGIGANTAIFSVMHAVLLRMLPVRDPQQLFYLGVQGAWPPDTGATGDSRYNVGINIYNRLREDHSAASDVIAYLPLAMTKTAARFGDTPEEIEADEVSGNLFSALGVKMAAGQAFTSADEEKHSPVAVISYGYWTRRFQRDPGIIGQTIHVSGVPLTIVGVTAPHFYGIESGGAATDLWVPLQNRPELPAWGVPPNFHTLYGNPNWWCMMILVRLQPGLTPQEAEARLNPIYRRAAYETHGQNVKESDPKLELIMIPARGVGTATKDYDQPLPVLMGMVGLVLVIACVNVVMLLAARNSVREREFSLRLALGASRWPFFRQLLTESALLVGAGAALGWIFAIGATRLLGIWSELEVSLAPDSAVLGFTLVVSAMIALIFGLAPLRTAARAPLTATLRSSHAQSTASRGSIFTGKIMIVLQMSFCAALLFAGGLLLRSLRNYQHTDLGMRAGQVLAVGIHPVGPRSGAEKFAFYHDLMERIRHLPGVQSVTVADDRPGTGWSDNNSLTLDGHELPYDGGKNMLRSNEIGPDYFTTLGIPVVEGRELTQSDIRDGHAIAVVNQTLADRYLKNRSALGHTLGDAKHLVTIVGVVRDSKFISADEQPNPTAWFGFWHNGISVDDMDVEVRSAGNPMELLPAIRRIVREMDPNVPLQKPIVLSAQFEESYLMPALFARLAVFFGGLAALLVAVGLYGTLAYRVNRRTLEIGLRMALGAPRMQVLWMVLRDSLILVVVGLAIGLPLAWFGSKLMASMLYNLPAHDLTSLTLAGLGVLAVSLAAAYLPARRAARLDPMAALRSE